jgi:hypothetical protein
MIFLSSTSALTISTDVPLFGVPTSEFTVELVRHLYSASLVQGTDVLAAYKKEVLKKAKEDIE